MKRVSTNFDSQGEETYHKKSRQGRRNDKQLDFLVDFMVQNPNVATGKFCTLNGRNNLAGTWEELVSALNGLRNPGVKEKDIKSWKESWRDLKTKVSKKASTLRYAKRQTGNKGIELQQLSEIEKKVLGIVGLEYIEGTECPDSFPEEQPNAIEELTKGNSNILNVVPTPITTEIHEYNEDDDDDNIMYENIEIIENTMLDMDDSNTLLDTIPTPIGTTSCSKSNNPPVTNVKKKKNVKLNTQFTTARDVFTNLANTNSQQTELITSTLSTIAECNKRMADAMVKMADNEERRIKMDEKLLDLLSIISSKLK